MAVKLKDIANHLNISVSTVSRVLTNKDRVDADTRKKVLDALEQFQYRPNEIARSLKSRTTKAIGLIVPDISNYFFSMVIKGVEAEVRKQGYHVIICNSDKDVEKEDEYTKFLLQKQISGLIIAIVSNGASFYEQYRKSDVPVVFIDNLPKLDSKYDYVVIDNEKAGYELTNHLINIGHKRIAVITGSLHESTAIERLSGWEKALQEHSIQICKKWIGIGDFTQDSGYRIMQGFLKQEETPTAVFAGNNSLAYGAMHAILDAGLKIPDDVALVCFDAIDFTGLIKPQITSVIQPAEYIGIIAGEIIIRKILNTKPRAYERIILEPQLEIKQSCGYRKA